MKLSASQVQFINNYLKKSGVAYVDVRFEMTDHVATALEGLEGDFYDNFKQYMLQHKKDLLKSGRKFSAAANRRSLKAFRLNVMKPVYLITFLVTYLLGLAAGYLFGLHETVEAINIVYSIILILAALHYIYNYFTTREKYSAADKLLVLSGGFTYWVLIAFKAERFVDSTPTLILFYLLFANMYLVVYVTYWQLVKQYKSDYGTA